MSADDGAPDAQTVVGRVSACTDGLLQIDCSVPTGCPRCARGEGCGQGLWGRPSGSLRVSLPGEASLCGRTVLLSLPARNLLAACALAYGLPLAGLITGAVAGAAAAGEGASVLGAVLGLGAGWAAARLVARSCRRLLQPSIRPWP